MELSYMAGFFDGEGSIGMYSRAIRRSYSVRVQLTQNEGAEATYILETFKGVYGGNISRQRSLSGRIKLNWQLNANGLLKFLTDMTPLLVLKKKQAEVALEWLLSRPELPRGQRGRIVGFSPEFLRYSDECSRVIKGLKTLRM